MDRARSLSCCWFPIIPLEFVTMRSSLRFATSIAILLLSGVPLFVFWGLTWISPWGFISLDDDPNFVRNPLVAGGLTWESAVQCFTNESLLAVYEPISVLFRLICVSIFGMHARAIVLVSLTLHITNAILLFVASLSTARLASNYRGRPSTRAKVGNDSDDRQMGACCGALLGAMWWAVSPQRVEAIAWPSAHGYSLSTVFCLLGWNLRLLRLRKLQGINDAGGIGGWAYNVAALLCFTTACFCKTSALPWVAAVAVLELILLSLLPDARHPYFRRVLMEWLVPGLLVSAVCARLAVVANHTASGNQTNDYWSHERKLIGSDKFARACLALWLTMARNTFCPPGWFNTPVSAVRYAVPMRLPLWPLHLDMVERMFGTSKTGTHEETDGSAHAAIYMSLTPWCVLATIVCTICSVQKCLQLAWRILISGSSAPSTRSFVRESFAVAWVAYAILMAPSLGFVQHGFLSITADRYSYLPSVIIAPILAGFGTWVGVCRGKSRCKLGRSIVIFVVLLLCFQARDAMHGLHRFGDSSRFWLSAIAADHTYGSAHVSAADIERKAAEMLPRDSDGAKMHNSQALMLYERALKLVPAYAAGWSNYGIALMNVNDLQAAIAAQRRAKRLAPHFVAARFNLGAALQFAGDENSAEKEYEELQLNEPSFLPAFMKHGALLHRRGRIQEALLKYNGALRADPYNVDVLTNSCLAHMNLSPPELDKALRLCRRALQINPLHSQSKHHLQKIAVLLENDGQRFSKDQPRGKAGGRSTMDENQGVKRQAAQYGGVACPHERETQVCNAHPCPVDCVVTNPIDTDTHWPWSGCSVSCGQGTDTRSRSILVPAAHGGVACPANLFEERYCNHGECPIHCVVSEWTQWGTCSKSCRDENSAGRKTRTRHVITPAFDGGFTAFQCPALEDRVDCNTHPCPNTGYKFRKKYQQPEEAVEGLVKKKPDVPLEEKLIYAARLRDGLEFDFNGTFYTTQTEEIGPEQHIRRISNSAVLRKIDLWKKSSRKSGNNTIEEQEFVKSWVMKEFNRNDGDLAALELKRSKRAGREYSPWEGASLFASPFGTNHVCFNMPFIPGVSVRNFGFEIDLKRKLLNFAESGGKKRARENNTTGNSTCNSSPSIKKIAKRYKSVIGKKIEEQVNFLHNKLNMAHGDLSMDNVMIVMNSTQKGYLKKCEDVEDILEMLETLDFRLIDFGPDRETFEKCMTTDEDELANLKRRDMERMVDEIDRVAKSPMQAEWV